MLRPRIGNTNDHGIVSVALVLLTLVLSLMINRVQADGPIVVDGDSFVLKDTPATYTVSLPNDYPGYVTFKYVFSLDLPKPRRDTILAGRSTSWQCDFTNVTVGNYNLNIQVYLQLMTLGWKIGEKKIAINVKDNLNDFFAIEGAQEGLPSYTTNYFFATNRTVNITAKLAEQNTYLAEPSTRYNFTWTLKSKTLNETTYKARTFNYSFIKAEDYDVSLNISAAFQLNGNEMHLVGHLATPFYVRIPLTIANLTFHGNNYVKNGQLLNLNISWCGASANYQFCYDFSYGNVSNTTCFDSPITLRQCYYNIRHYFPHNGTQYVNFGVRNDVSEIATAVKITIYKVGPRQSLLFVIVPMVGTVAVLVIAVSGIAYHIKQRMRLNATIEEATADNIDIYPSDDDTPLLEKSLVARIRESFHFSFR